MSQSTLEYAAPVADSIQSSWPAASRFRPIPLLVVIRSTADLPAVIEPVMEAMARQDYPERDRFAVRLSLEEALVNAIKHGHRGDPGKEVRVRYQITAEEVMVEIEDEGPGFDLASVADPTAAENLERTGGRGVLLMHYYMTRVRYEGRGNRITLWKCRSAT